MKKIITFLLVFLLIVGSLFAQRAATTETRDSQTQSTRQEQRVSEEELETQQPTQPTQRPTLEERVNQSSTQQPNRVISNESSNQPTSQDQRTPTEERTHQPVRQEQRFSSEQKPVQEQTPAQTQTERATGRTTQSQAVFETVPAQQPTSRQGSTTIPESRIGTGPDFASLGPELGRIPNNELGFDESLIERTALSSVDRMRLILASIDLDAPQRVALDRLHINFQIYITENFFELKRLLSEFQITANSYNFNRSGRIALEINNLRGDIALMTINYLEDIVSVMTPEQREQAVRQRGTSWLVD